MSDSELQKIRARLAADGNFSHTSLKFQDDLLFYATKFAAHGNCIIEVGCWKGGLSAQFAYLARKLGQRFVAIDSYATYLEHARRTVEVTGAGEAVFHLGDFQSFVATIDPALRPTLVLIDADHQYDAVTADIRTLYAMPSRPYCAAFHDFSLRYSTPEQSGVRVDRALVDAFGADFQHIKIGEVAGAGSTLITTPQPDGHYHELGYPEGALINCRTMAPKWSS